MRSDDITPDEYGFLPEGDGNAHRTQRRYEGDRNGDASQGGRDARAGIGKGCRRTGRQGDTQVQQAGSHAGNDLGTGQLLPDCFNDDEGDADFSGVPVKTVMVDRMIKGPVPETSPFETASTKILHESRS